MINRVILTGRITTDIELRQTNDGTNYTFFTIAVNRQGNNDQTDFISCVSWRNTAEFMNKYLSKGSLIGVEGRLEVYRTQKDGNYEIRTNVNVSQVHFLETKSQSDFRKQNTQETPVLNKAAEKIDNAINEDSKFDTSSEKTNNEEINFDDIQF